MFVRVSIPYCIALSTLMRKYNCVIIPFVRFKYCFGKSTNNIINFAIANFILLIQYIHFYLLDTLLNLRRQINCLIIVISAVQYGIETRTNKICDVTLTKCYLCRQIHRYLHEFYFLVLGKNICIYFGLLASSWLSFYLNLGTTLNKHNQNVAV